MTLLLKSYRESIVKHLLDATFRERELRLKQCEHALGLQLLRALYSADDLRRMAELPKGWLPMTSKLIFSDAHNKTPFMTNHVDLADPVRVPSYQLHTYHDAPADWLVKWAALDTDRRATKEERRQLMLEVRGTLAAFRTVEKLAAGWPEGYAHFPHQDLISASHLPALRIEDLNARLTAARAA